MPNISITYSAAGQADIDAGNDIELKSMSVSNDGSSWIDCTDCKWTGSLYEGTVTATSDDYEISYVRVTYNSDEVLCSGSGTTIATLANGQSLAISFKPNDICTGLITNTSSGGGGGGGEIDPAILNAKQDKAIPAFKTLNWQDEATTVEAALQNLKTGILNTGDTLAVTSKVFVRSASEHPTDTTIYWLLSNEPDQPTPPETRSGRSILLHGTMQDVSTAHLDGAVKLCKFDLQIMMVSNNKEPKSTILQGVYYGVIPDGCDIFLTEDQKLWLKLKGGGPNLRAIISGGHDLPDGGATANPPSSPVVASMSTDCVNLSAGGGGRNLFTVPLVPVEVDP